MGSKLWVLQANTLAVVILFTPVLAFDYLICTTSSDCTSALCKDTCSDSVHFYSNRQNVISSCRDTQGYSCDGLATAKCPGGTWKDLVLNPTAGLVFYQCISCRTGKYFPYQDSTSLPTRTVGMTDPCLFCPAGSYSSVKATSCSTCGSYSEPNSEKSNCELCGAGKFGTLTGCSPCAAGTFRAATDYLASSCLGICPAGSYSGAGATACTLCESGKAQGSPQQSTCNTCPAGTYVIGLGQSVCTPCPAGTWSGATAATRANTCQACAAGSFSNAGASVCSICTAGTLAVSSGLSICSSCPAGSYNLNSGSSVCTACGTGRFSAAAGGSSATVCQSCAAGRYASNAVNSACTSCTAGTYSGETGASTISTCVSCNAGTFSGVTGATSAAACQNCPAGTYVVAAGASACTRCVAGKVGTAVGALTESPTCASCTPGTFAGSAGLTTCSNCTVSGTYQPNSGGSVCPACPSGTYQSGTAQQICMACREGKFNSITGRTTENACLNCAVGTFALYSFSQCTRCAAGSYAEGTAMSACVACETGKFQSGSGFGVCLLCQEGRFQNATQQTVCRLCPTGSSQPSQGQATCLLCARGLFQSLTGKTECDICPAASATNNLGASVCSVCSAGKAQSLTGQSACITCGPGQHQPATNTTGCIDCIAGRFNGWNASQWEEAGQPPECTSCARGTYGVAVRQTACLLCEEDSFQSSTGQTFCLGCASGVFAGRGQSACSNCSAGNYQDWEVSGLCDWCSPGKYQPGRGRTTCILCPSGRYNQKNASVFLDECLRCLPGTFLPVTGGTSCIDCALGTYQTMQGATRCEQCSSGAYTSVAGPISGCQGCGAGLYQRSPGSTICEECTPCGNTGFRWTGCNGTHDATCRNCTVCTGGGLETVRPCTVSTDAICGGVGQCWRNRTSLMRVYPWVLADRKYRCNAGQYLLGFEAVVGSPGEVSRTCVPCPAGWVGLNGVVCERCGELQEPYYLDGSSCVCKAPSVMNATGGCQCPDGFEGKDGACRPCARDSYGEGGVCFACSAGKTTGDLVGATGCQSCSPGLYRWAGGQGGCRNCSIDGWFAPDPTQGVCVGCNKTCAKPGWRWKQFCPGDESGNFSVCEECSGGLPANATWSNLTVNPIRRYMALEECAYSCDRGFYHDSSGCHACNTSRVCDAGYRLTPCTEESNSHCDVVCEDAEKPRLYSHWIAGSNACEWACDDGKILVVSDYVIFTLRECV